MIEQTRLQVYNFKQILQVFANNYHGLTVIAATQSQSWLVFTNCEIE